MRASAAATFANIISRRRPDACATCQSAENFRSCRTARKVGHYVLLDFGGTIDSERVLLCTPSSERKYLPEQLDVTSEAY